MKIIVGLGNPGQQYCRTRHNIGFLTVDALAKQCGVTVWKNMFEAETARVTLAGHTVLLVKPQTYMNLSGNAVGALVRWHKALAEDVVAIYDDMDLAVGKARIRKSGGSGGHRGVESLLVHLGEESFARVRIGIGRPKPGMTVNHHVLSEFTEEEIPVLDQTVKALLPAVEAIIEQGIEKAMNLYNLKFKG